MSEDLDILKIVAENPSISQRKIAERTGSSLGQVSFLIKKFVKKGLIKIEGQSSKSLRYNLTPKGITEKATLTLEYIKISYDAVSVLTDKIKCLVEEYVNKGVKIFVYGANDEMMQIIKLVLNGDHITCNQWRHIDNNLDEVELINNGDGYVILCWESALKEELKGKHLNVINVLE